MNFRQRPPALNCAWPTAEKKVPALKNTGIFLRILLICKTIWRRERILPRRKFQKKTRFRPLFHTLFPTCSHRTATDTERSERKFPWGVSSRGKKALDRGQKGIVCQIWWKACSPCYFFWFFLSEQKGVLLHVLYIVSIKSNMPFDPKKNCLTWILFLKKVYFLLCGRSILANVSKHGRPTWPQSRKVTKDWLDLTLSLPKKKDNVWAG